MRNENKYKRNEGQNDIVGGGGRKRVVGDEYMEGKERIVAIQTQQLLAEDSGGSDEVFVRGAQTGEHEWLCAATP